MNSQHVPDGGCQGEAARSLEGGTTAGFEPGYPNELAFEAESRTWADSRVVAQVDAWRSCMKRLADSTIRHIEAGGDPAWRSDDPTTPASERERAVAVADARCNQQNKLSDTAAAVDIADHNELIEKNRQHLTDFMISKQVVLHNAATIAGR